MYVGKYSIARNIVLVGSGWKSISMVDVHGSVTFTLWLCGCNLKCPFCHNWRLAVMDKDYCRELDIETLVEELEHAKFLIDYLHVTGGEPLVQYKGLEKFFQYVRESLDIEISLNTNLTLTKPLENMLKKNLLTHIATDLKIPFPVMTGYPYSIAEALWKRYLDSLKLIVEYNVLLELRIPVAKKITLENIGGAIDVLDILDGHEYYVVVEPLLGKPITSPRDNNWCRQYCNPGREELNRVREWFVEKGVDKVYVKETIGVD